MIPPTDRYTAPSRFRLKRVTYGFENAALDVERRIETVGVNVNRPGAKASLGVIYEILPAIASIRDPAFAEEQEWRIVVAIQGIGPHGAAFRAIPRGTRVCSARDAETQAALPLVEPLEGEAEQRDLDLLDAEIALIGSDTVRDGMRNFANVWTEFFKRPFGARAAAQREIENPADVDAAERAIRIRMDLGSVAARMRAATDALEEAMRREIE